MSKVIRPRDPKQVTHMRHLIRKLENQHDRPRLSDMDRVLIAGLLRQECLRRVVILSDMKRLEKLGVKIEDLEY